MTPSLRPPTRPPRVHAALLAAALLAAATPLAAQRTGQTLIQTGTATFGTQNQSLWNAGPATVIEKSFSVNKSWSKMGGFNAISGSRCDPVFCLDTRTGFALGAYTSGSVSFDASARVNSGSLDGDASVRTRLVASRPSDRPQTGDAITLKTRMESPNVEFSTEGPSVQARAAVSGRLNVGMFGTGCFIGFGCKSSTSTLVNLPAFTQEIASYNWNESGKLRIFGQDLPGFNFGEPIGLPIPGASFTLFTPDLDVDHAAGGTKARGVARTDVARLDIDPIQLGLSVALPGSECILSCSIDLGIFDVDYTLFSATLGAVVGLRQEIDFSLARPFTRLDFSMPTRVRQGGVWSGPVSSANVDGWGGDLEVEYVSDAHGIPLVVTPTYGMVGSLRNSTFLTIDPSITMTVLEGSAAGFSFGPVYEHEWRFSGLSIPIFSTAFEVPLGSFTGQSLALGTWPSLASPAPGAPAPPPPYDPWQAVAAPEPGSLVLAATGLVLLGAVARRRRAADLRAA